jgi:hypothetical protein
MFFNKNFRRYYYYDTESGGGNGSGGGVDPATGSAQVSSNILLTNLDIKLGASNAILSSIESQDSVLLATELAQNTLVSTLISKVDIANGELSSLSKLSDISGGLSSVQSSLLISNSSLSSIISLQTLSNSKLIDINNEMINSNQLSQDILNQVKADEYPLTLDYKATNSGLNYMTGDSLAHIIILHKDSLGAITISDSKWINATTNQIIPSPLGGDYVLTSSIATASDTTQNQLLASIDSYAQTAQSADQALFNQIAQGNSEAVSRLYTNSLRYKATIAGLGYNVGDIIDKVTLVRAIDASGSTVGSFVYINVTMGTIITIAPPSGNLALYEVYPSDPATGAVQINILSKLNDILLSMPASAALSTASNQVNQTTLLTSIQEESLKSNTLLANISSSLVGSISNQVVGLSSLSNLNALETTQVTHLSTINSTLSTSLNSINNIKTRSFVGSDGVYKALQSSVFFHAGDYIKRTMIHIVDDSTTPSTFRHRALFQNLSTGAAFDEALEPIATLLVNFTSYFELTNPDYIQNSLYQAPFSIITDGTNPIRLAGAGGTAASAVPSLIVQESPNSRVFTGYSSAVSAKYRSSTLSNVSQQVSSTTSRLLGWNIVNKNTTPIYIKLYNSVTASVGIDSSTSIICVGAGSYERVPINFYTQDYFSTAISVACVSDYLDSNNTAPTIPVFCELYYIY